ncbi:UvrD-helicase domain-containing protein [Candidatus Halobeggiatoa sp. HSG11]|nr:UvrD-helicase domain-containing protein [Candidatus Halobeggiatoa sp. HSG11]
MDISKLTKQLNKEQLTAVTASLEHILVLAGAGSGKTRCLTYRIAWLITTGQTNPHNILAVTFTNKAANEMRSRIDSLLDEPAKGLWVGTFHGIAHRFLRTHWQDAKLSQSFQILDSNDQLRSIKRLLKALGADEKVYSPQKIQNFINSQKDEGLRAKNLTADENDVWLNQMIEIYQNYEENCQRSDVVDFGELLLRCYETLRDNPHLLEYYQQRFQFIHVDEFQDTNNIQYKWLQLLAGTTGKLFVVFDDDQSIYSWRGAKVQNIQHLQQDFTDTKLIKLEQNYRSTSKILNAANVLIANNTDRLGKNLWTEHTIGEPITLYRAYSEVDEAWFVTEQILNWQGKKREVAILYRTTAQSRQFEEILLQKNIPYRIYGGLRFYERLEIKDILAYLRLSLNRNDDTAFERVVNTPKRGIGERTVVMLRSEARQQKISLWQVSVNILANDKLKKRAASSLHGFMTLVKNIAKLNLPLRELIEQAVIDINLVEHYQKSGKEEAQGRLENLAELANAAHQFEQQYNSNASVLNGFLDHAALESGEKQSKSSDCVQLMTLHSAKGLEFEVVFLCGLEEELFPHKNSLDDFNLEEERRLCYVGITRARRFLYLCHSNSRFRYGERSICKPSRFIEEIPKELINKVRL